MRATRRLIGLGLALALAASPTLAGDVTPPTPIDLTANAMLLAGGAGTQTDPHISGALVSYTAFDWATIHYYDFTSGADKIIVKSDSYTTDALSDVSGSTIVFNRNSVGDKRVMFSTVSSGVASTPQELAPLTDTTITPLRQRAAVLKAANLGDDADTTAAVCGQVAGAFYGEAGIPRRWLGKLAMRLEVTALAESLCHAGSAGLVK